MNQNPWINILFNIAFPVIILNYASQISPLLTPPYALVIALSFPIIYGLVDYTQNKNKNILSIVGIVNTLLTGGFALFVLDGFWFAVKEAAIPLALGIGVLISIFTKTPLMKWFIHRTSIFKIDLILSRLDSELKVKSYGKLIKKSTFYIAGCFFLSAVLNFALAMYIFKNTLPQKASLVDHQEMLNEQIANMTWISFLVIGLPLSIVTVGTLWWLMAKIKQLTLLSFEEILNTENMKK